MELATPPTRAEIYRRTVEIHSPMLYIDNPSKRIARDHRAIPEPSNMAGLLTMSPSLPIDMLETADVTRYDTETNETSR
jgi:hypothetical protein